MTTFLIISGAFILVFGLLPALSDAAGEASPGPTSIERLKGFVKGALIIGAYLAGVWILLFKVIL